MSVRRVEKGWGHELIWANGPGYTGKILHFDRPGAHCSLHYHLKKDETWLVLHGSFEVTYVRTHDGTREARVLKEGAVWHNPPGLPHQLIALTDGAEVAEVSSPDDPDDNYRIQPGDSQR